LFKRELWKPKTYHKSINSRRLSWRLPVKQIAAIISVATILYGGVSLKLGFHVSISGSIDRAVDRASELGCDTFQIFTRNPRSWRSRPLGSGEVEGFREKRLRSGIDPVYSHMPYILNLASPDDDIYGRSQESLAEGISRCHTLGVPMLVTHLGSHLGEGAEGGVERVIGALDAAIGEGCGGVTVLLENGSGSENKVGSSFEELSRIVSGVEHPDRVAVCLDTCHAFAAGYDVGTPRGLEEALLSFDELIGFGRLMLVHLNDSVGALGSGVDHHEHIGLGGIGLEGFRGILGSRLSEVPMIMETPIDDRRVNEGNMRVVRELAASLEREGGLNR
jgi:deoxyribonuclease-4